MIKPYTIEKALVCDSFELAKLFAEIVGNASSLPEAVRQEAIKVHTPKYMARRVTRDADYLLVARNQKGIVGFTIAHETSDEFVKHSEIPSLTQPGLWSSWTCVTPSMRQHHIATDLLAELENYAIHAGKRAIECAVAIENLASQKLCLNLGFHPNGFIELTKGITDIRLLKELPTPSQSSPPHPYRA